MKELFYQPENAWVGDLIPYYEDGVYYGFYLHDPRKREGEFAEETTWHLVTTKDFQHVQYHGEAIARGTENDPNHNIFTGSVIQDKNGIYHAFYTAYNEKLKVDGKSVQSVMQAVGEDIHHLKTMEDFRFVADGEKYEEFDWRDPYVFYQEDEECYYMLLAARRKGAGGLRGGCVSLSKSTDLIHWTYEEPFYDPKMYITMECPEVFQMGDYWYLVYSTFSDRFTTHYRYASSVHGPWIIPDDDVFDTRANYAIKTASDGVRRYAFGWIASKTEKNDFGDWEWGGTMVFHEIVQNKNNGELSVRATDGMREFYNDIQNTETAVHYNCSVSGEEKEIFTSETLGAVLYDVPKDCFLAEYEFEVECGQEFGIALHTDAGMEQGYFLRMDPHRRQVAWDIWPRGEKGKYQWQIKGDVPYQIETSRRLPQGNKFRIMIVREEDICVVYINEEVALSTRMYNHKGGKTGVYVLQGTINHKKITIKTKEN